MPTLNENGVHVGGIVGFLKSIGFAINMFNPTRTIIVFDGKGGSNRRRKLHSDYKNKRRTSYRVNRVDGLENLEDEHEGKTTIQLQMKGNVEDPIISLDQIQLRKDVVEGIIKETEEITNIIKNDILDNTDPMEEYQKEDSGIELEWEDENK